MQTEIKLKKVYKLLKNSIDDLLSHYIGQNFTKRDIDLWTDIVRLYNLTEPPASTSGDGGSALVLEPGNSEYRYVSEPELLQLFNDDIIDQDVPTLLGLDSKTIPAIDCPKNEQESEQESEPGSGSGSGSGD